MKKQAMNPGDLELIKNYLLGGAALGAGAGAGTALLNQLNELKREASEASTPRKDVLKLTLRTPQSREASEQEKMASMMRGPLAIVGGLLAAGGGYAGVRALHQYMKKRELQKQLDEAQNGYIDVLDTEAGATKQAAAEAAAGAARKGMQPAEAMWSVPLSAALLLGLASGVVTNQTLKHNFPDRQPASRLLPRRVVVERQDDADPEAEETAITPIDKNATAMFFATTAELCPLNSDVADAIKAAAAGRYVEMTKVANQFGTEMMLDSVKGAASYVVPPVREKLATQLLAEDETIAPSLRLVAAAEFLDHGSNFLKLARALPVSLQAALVKYAAEFYAQQVIEGVTIPALTAAVEPDAVKNAFKASARELVIRLLESPEFELAAA